MPREPHGSDLLADALEDQDLTVTAAAAELDVSRTRVSMLLSGNGRDGRPSLELAVKLEELFGIPPRSWIAGTPRRRRRR